MGDYFEDLPGQTFKHWPSRTITEFDNTLVHRDDDEQ